MASLDFWLKQPTIEVLHAIFLLANKPIPNSVQLLEVKRFPADVRAILRRIEDEMGATAHRRSPKLFNGKLMRLRTEIDQDEFRELAAKLDLNLTQSTPEAIGSVWPWGHHETELLRHMAEAAKRFWANVDLSEQDTIPENNDVIEWLQGRGVSLTVAQSMATILRADGAPRGRRKR